jgi:2-iminobutanoate/2-iminopropanoate deaminase
MDREIIKVASMPAANPTYSQAVKAGEFLFVAGQTGFDYGASRLADGGMRGQTRQALENIRAILEAAGSSLEKVVNVTIFVTDMDQWAEGNEVYAEFFPKDGPAKATAEVTCLAFDALVEIQVVAVA